MGNYPLEGSTPVDSTGQGDESTEPPGPESGGSRAESHAASDSSTTTDAGGDEPPLLPSLDALDLGELLDLVEQLLGWLRVSTFDELEGERDAADRAKALLARYGWTA